MTITITRQKAASIISGFLKVLKWPLALILFGLIISPRFWTFWRYASPNAKLILAYIDVLKWPVVVLYIFILTRKYIPDVIDRIEEVTAGKMGLKLREPNNQKADTDEIKKLPDSTEPAESSSENDSTQNLDELLTTPEVESEFDRIYEAIYGSQLMVMKRLLDYVPEGLSEDKLYDLYDAHLKSALSPYPGFKHFIQFLQDMTMVLYDLNDERYKLTNAGLYFLRYLNRVNKYNLMPPN